MEERYIPKYLNAQIQLLWWELDEMIVLMAFVGLGIVADHTYIFAGLGIIAMNIYSKLNNQKQPGFFKHVMYRFGFWGKKHLPEYWVKELVR
ncbi:type IV conjugative transfer system protein TraL [Sulfuricurvum sp. IAE1]|uniref:type IV conjugative transfer system protein TraL n=1 Tax=Sulfuricurvum sp. IAE1 TaxID=2546102 RepID=UPI00105395CE|nr:type IV conjugative transfer system protein TraL [Sulfuricurvum sp. IAE1]TDA63644.1 type IV conjugative transfer system protein TraL [Sulfuricurvum sp. IAE1]